MFAAYWFLLLVSALLLVGLIIDKNPMSDSFIINSAALALTVISLSLEIFKLFKACYNRRQQAQKTIPETSFEELFDDATMLSPTFEGSTFN